MIRTEDIGELAYGGLVTALKYFDSKRIAEGKLTDKAILKKMSTYGYLVPGAGATILSAFGSWRRYNTWLEHISHGFIYAFPGWLTNVVQTMSSNSNAGSAAVREAQRIIANGQLTQGQSTHRTYQKEFRKVVAW